MVNRILRKQKLGKSSMVVIEAALQLFYPLKGPFLYPGNVDDLEGAERLGKQQCAALAQHTIPIGLTATWREGIRVKGNGHRIKKGTAATFEDGFYPTASASQ